MNFSPEDRSLLQRLGDILVPGSAADPSASTAGIGGRGLDEVIAARPDLGPPLRGILNRATSQNPGDFVTTLQAADPGAFDTLAEIVFGAYFLMPDVRAALNYHGQVPKPLTADPEPLEPLLDSVRRRGPVYRPTPGMTNQSP